MNIENISPYITVIKHNEKIYYGILRAKTKEYITIYNLDLMDEQQKISILKLAKSWWWESNRTIPISLYMKEDVEPFKTLVTRFNSNSIEVISGPCISLNDIPSKRIKRRNITLKKKR